MTLVAKCRRVVSAVGRVTVEGASMEPSLATGDRLVLVPAMRLRPGHIVALSDPRRPGHLLVKRIKSLDHRSKLIWLEGDNPTQCTDSRTFGAVRSQAVRGRAVYRYAPAGRVGPIGRGR